MLDAYYFNLSVLVKTAVYCLMQGSAGSWCSRAKFQVFKNFAGHSFSDI